MKNVMKMKSVDKHRDLAQSLVKHLDIEKLHKSRYYDTLIQFIKDMDLLSLVVYNDETEYEYSHFREMFNSIEWHELMMKFYPDKILLPPFRYTYFMDKIKHFSKQGRCTYCYTKTNTIPLDCSIHWMCYECYKGIDGECDECARTRKVE
jgi:hypothetical protein